METEETIPAEYQTFEAPNTSTEAEKEKTPKEISFDIFDNVLDLLKGEGRRTVEEGPLMPYGDPRLEKISQELRQARETITQLYRESSIEEKQKMLKTINYNTYIIEAQKKLIDRAGKFYSPVYFQHRFELGNLISEISKDIGDDLENEKFYEIPEGINVLASGVELTSGLEKSKILHELIHHWPLIKSSLPHDLKEPSKEAGPKEYGPYEYKKIFDILLTYGDISLHEDVKAVILQTLQTAEDSKYKIAIGAAGIDAEWQTLESKNAPIKQLISDSAARFGLDGEKMISYWREGRSKDANESLMENLLELNALEQESPGISKKLYDEFGIACYSRYDRKMLIDQARNIDDTELPYGVAIYPRADHNGAFSRPALLANVASELAGNAHLRIAEVGNKYELMRTLLRLEKKYNPKGDGHKISFAILGGHGTKNSIQFGEGGNFFELFSDDLYGTSAGRSADIFEPNPTIVLQSCSTGQDRGIGMTLSYILHAKVVAPDIPTNIATINTSIHEGKIDLEVTYSDEDSKKVYKPKKRPTREY